MFDFIDYESKAFRTCNPNLSMKQLLTNAALGLTGESGEFADNVKKHLFHGHDLDAEECKKELGDILWYLNLACFTVGTTLQDVAEANITKLEKRYPDKFNSQDSINRIDSRDLVDDKFSLKGEFSWHDDMNSGHNV